MEKGKRGINIIIVLLTGALLVSGSVREIMAYASEFGGFDISTETGESGGDWSDWDDEPAYDTPEQGNSSDEVENIRDDVQDTLQDSADSGVTDNGYYENDTVTSRRPQESSEAAGNVSSSYEQNYEEEELQSGNRNRTDNETGSGNENVSNSVAIPTSTPTKTPTPVPTPVLTPTDTPTPAFTEVPQEEINKITEYKEEYHLPPAECMSKMKLIYWREELPGGTYAEVRSDNRLTQNVMSVRINGQEKEWSEEMEEGQKILKLQGLSEEINYIELAVMLPADLTWTREQKNVILTCKVF